MKKLYLAAMLASSSGEAFSQTAVASWYDQPGITASGERYDPKKLTAAHRTLPFGSIVHLRNGKRKVRVEITGRGPFISGRQFDLSKAAAIQLGVQGVSLIEVLKVRKKPKKPKRRS